MQTAAERDPARDPGIDVPSNRLFVHPVGRWLLPAAIRLGVHPNAVSMVGLTFGIAAAGCFWHWADPSMALLGWCCLIAWLVMDGLDGALARATGRESAFGRFVDGFSDYGVFVVVHFALALSLVVESGQSPTVFALALAAGAAHAVQSAWYEAARAAFLRRARGVFSVAERQVAGGPVEALYNRMESALGHRATALDARLGTLDGEARQRLLEAWQARVRSVFPILWLLSSNARVHVILLACLAKNPQLAWWWELLGLSALAVMCGWWWRRAEAIAVEAGSDAP
jgi:phosphatidylglycerophosphate synthase